MTTKQYITSRKVQERFGISAMTLWRWERDRRLSFPKPTNINRRKYFDLAEVEAWERQHALASAANGGK